MSRRAGPLDRLFAPRTVAVIGASASPDRLSGRPLRILAQHGFPGRVYPVNPRYDELLGLRCYPDIGAVPEPVDVALVAVAAERVPGVLDACGAASTSYAVVISSGFAERGDEQGSRRHAEMAAVLRRRPGMRVSGPNAEGFVVTHGPVPVGFSPTIDYERGLDRLLTGDVAVVAQSGGLGFAVFNDGQARGLGFSTVVSTGNEVDLDALDFTEHLLDDPHTRVVLLFVEGFTDLERFRRLAERARGAGVPLVVAKVGRSAAGRRAALAHTAHDTGDDDAYQEAFDRFGVVRVEDSEDLVDAGITFARAPLPAGRRVAVLTVSGGAGAWAADALEREGLTVAPLATATQAAIRPLIPAYGCAANPVDVTAQVIETAGGLAPVLDVLLTGREVDIVVLVTTLASSHRLAAERDRLAGVLAASGKPVLVYSYTRASPDSVELLRELGLAWYPSVARVARAARLLVDRASR